MDEDARIKFLQDRIESKKKQVQTEKNIRAANASFQSNQSCMSEVNEKVDQL